MNQCQCLTTKGLQCKNKAKEGSPFCGVHQKKCEKPIGVITKLPPKVQTKAKPKPQSSKMIKLKHGTTTDGKKFDVDLSSKNWLLLFQTKRDDLIYEIYLN